MCLGAYSYAKTESIIRKNQLTEGLFGEEEWSFSWDVCFQINVAMYKKFQKILENG